MVEHRNGTCLTFGWSLVELTTQSECGAGHYASCKTEKLQRGRKRTAEQVRAWQNYL